MNKKVLLPLALLVAASSFSGCAHQTSGRMTRSSYAFGLVEIDRGAFQPAPAVSLDANVNEYLGNAGSVSGTQTRIAWGLITTNDY